MPELFATGLHVVNVLLILGLLFIYVQNYRKLKSKYTIGLMVFAVFFLVQSLMGIFFDVSMVMYSSTTAEKAATALEAIKAVAFGVLLWISWD